MSRISPRECAPAESLQSEARSEGALAITILLPYAGGGAMSFGAGSGLGRASVRDCDAGSRGGWGGITTCVEQAADTRLTLMISAVQNARATVPHYMGCGRTRQRARASFWLFRRARSASTLSTAFDCFDSSVTACACVLFGAASDTPPFDRAARLPRRSRRSRPLRDRERYVGQPHTQSAIEPT